MEIHDVATLVAVLVGCLAAVLAVANVIVIVARLTHRDLVAASVARSVSRFTWWLRMADGGKPAASDLGSGPR